MPKNNKELSGHGVAGGIVSGPAFVYLTGEINIPKYHISKTDIPGEIRKYINAVARAKQEILDLENVADSYIKQEANDLLKAHIQIIEDPTLHQETIKELKKNLLNIEFIINKVLLRIINKFNQMQNPYIRERVNDIIDIRTRLLKAFQKKNQSVLETIDKPIILVADNLYPTDTIKINKKYLLGIITAKGEETSHTTILAKSYGIPTIINIPNITNYITNNDNLILDAENGKVVINPTADTISQYTNIRDFFTQKEQELSPLVDKRTFTLDNRRVEIAANIESFDEIDTALSKGSEAIGLVRTEYIFIEKHFYNDEEAQYLEYKKMVKKIDTASIIFRTLDIGGDKLFLSKIFEKDPNPFLGFRAIRYSLKHKKEFKKQIKAILRAGNHGDVKLLLPMISGEEELDKALKEIKSARDQLQNDNIPFSNVPIGVLIEVPSAAILIDRIIKKVDYISIGSNDLIQYTIAADRTNPQVSYLYDPFHPAVLHLINNIIKACKQHNKKVTICGEMGSDPLTAFLMVGMGIDGLSMSSSSILKIKKVISGIEYKEAQTLTQEILKLQNSKKTHKLLFKYLNTKLPYIFEKRNYK